MSIFVGNMAACDKSGKPIHLVAPQLCPPMIVWQCVKTNSTPVVHIKIAGLKWMFIPLKMVCS